MKGLVIGAAVVSTLAFGGATLATSDNVQVPEHNIKVNICHRTHSEKNPWEAIQVAGSAVKDHFKHGDFLYFGPKGENGKPTRYGDGWCEKHVPHHSPSPSPTMSPSVSPIPSATPTPSTSPTPSVTPTPTPAVTVETSTALPSVGGTGKARP